MLPLLSFAEVQNRRRPAFGAEHVAAAEKIIEAVRREGEPALHRFGVQFGEISLQQKLIYEQQDLLQAWHRLATPTQQLLERVAARIRGFAQAQRGTLQPLSVPIAGGRAGHEWLPVTSAGCYAPGGRYPLPSTVLMTAATAKAAGVADITVATPKPSDLMLGAAMVAGATRVLGLGGAQAIAAMALGVAVPRAAMVVGPGNAYVTAAKFLLSHECGIDMLGGPSELLVVADASADPARIVADLLAQAEHDPLAQAGVILLDQKIYAPLQQALQAQLTTLPTAAIARAAMANSFALVATSEDEAASWCNALAPEHLQLSMAGAWAFRAQLHAYGALFIGEDSAEVLGDYGMGPNHSLPTGSTARFAAGLSVASFLKCRTWLLANAQAPDYAALMTDTIALAECEGLAAHAAAARQRLR